MNHKALKLSYDALASQDTPTSPGLGEYILYIVQYTFQQEQVNTSHGNEKYNLDHICSSNSWSNEGKNRLGNLMDSLVYPNLEL